MAMLVSLADMKLYLGIDSGNTTYDAFLNSQIVLISDSIEGYCGRHFVLTEWIQSFYRKDFIRESAGRPVYELPLFHFPVLEASEVIEDEVELSDSEWRLNKKSGILVRDNGWLWNCELLTVQYEAGFSQSEIPSPVRNAVFELVEERYNKKSTGVSLNFGSDVQRISIPGAISIDFDYSLNNNERKNAFGSILGSQLNVLDYYRSERAIIGSGKLEYVEEFEEEEEP